MYIKYIYVLVTNQSNLIKIIYKIILYFSRSTNQEIIKKKLSQFFSAVLQLFYPENPLTIEKFLKRETRRKKVALQATVKLNSKRYYFTLCTCIKKTHFSFF